MFLIASGGLGNQLFALAAALHISEVRGVRVVMLSDNSELVRSANSALSEFPKPSKFRIVFSPRINKLGNIVNSKINLSDLSCNSLKRLKDKVGWVVKTPWEFPWSYLQKGTPLPKLLSGFFQDVELIEQLSENSQNYLLSILTCPSEQTERNSITKEIVGVHIRGGDYSQIPSYGILSSKYFESALEKVGQERDTLVVISSDEESFLRKFEVLGDKNCLFPHSNSPLETIKKFTSVRKFIMSNSTFSFWIGWAVLRQKGQVFAPSPWFKSAWTPNNYLYLSGVTKFPAIFVDNLENW